MGICKERLDQLKLRTGDNFEKIEMYPNGDGISGEFAGLTPKIPPATDKVNIKGKDYFQNDNSFSLTQIDNYGKTNLQRMSEGFPPIGHDGFPINLHHTDQTMTGAITEITATEHCSKNGALHQSGKKSEINRTDFNGEKNEYWKARSKGVIEEIGIEKPLEIKDIDDIGNKWIGENNVVDSSQGIIGSKHL